MIYHVVSQARWEASLPQGFYEADSLATEGFIHACGLEQVKGVLERYYRQQTGLVLLHIDETKLAVPLKFEPAPSVNEDFPHIYGRLNTDAVIKVIPI